MNINLVEKSPPVDNKVIHVPVGNVMLYGNLTAPENAIGLVIFSHGSGSSRFSPRNNFVAQQLYRRGIATILVDLLTAHEDEHYASRFNINLLTERLISITKWLSTTDEVNQLPIGYFGASTGAASALHAAALLPNKIVAIVSRGGRPDLAMEYLRGVKAPTLLIVGELDYEVALLNKQAFDELQCVKKLSVVPGATHLFEEPGSLEDVSVLAGMWFSKYFLKVGVNH
jgi:putative phosphoribosyl transferase